MVVVEDCGGAALAAASSRDMSSKLLRSEEDGATTSRSGREWEACEEGLEVVMPARRETV
jgi:hypothetical protein